MNKIQRVPLQHEIIEYIRNYMQEQALKPGDKLPSQSELMEMMGVSRTALREAIKTLEAKGVLEVKNGKGVYVAEDFKEALCNQLSFTKEKEDLIQMLEVRGALEREMLKMIVQKASDEELAELGRIVEVLMDKYRRGVRQNEEDEAFHNMLYRLCHHAMFEQMLDFLHNQMKHMWQFPLNMKDPFTATIPLHEELYKALCERNARKAIEINKTILKMEIQEIKEQS